MLKIKNKLSALLLVLGAAMALSACETANVNNSIRPTTAIKPAKNTSMYTPMPGKSLASLENQYSLNPKNENAARDFAIALRANGNNDQARIILEPFAKLKGASTLTLSEFSAILLAQGRPKDAETFAGRAITADGKNFQAYQRLGIALDAQGDAKMKKDKFVQAERAYRKSLELWQGDPTSIMNNLALNLASQKHLPEAIEILRKADEISPNRTEIQRNLRIVMALQQAEGFPVPKPGRKPRRGV